MKPLIKKLIWLAVFSIAMGFMETAIVVYLRKLYYSQGFSFPLAPIEPAIALIEFMREAATIIMLIAIGILTGKTAAQKFSFFIFCFGIWDIVYYLFLKLLINWPDSLFTWDILFLIPIPWVGPVIAPCIAAVTMVILALAITYYSEKKTSIKLNLKEWLSLISGSFIIILSFLYDYFSYTTGTSLIKQHHDTSGKVTMLNQMAHYIPSTYNWYVFSAGELMLIYGILIFIRRVKNA